MISIDNSSFIPSTSFKFGKLPILVWSLIVPLLMASCKALPDLERNHVPFAVADSLSDPTAPPMLGQVSNERAGIFSERITIGSCCALSGPAAELGKNLVSGAKSYLNYINERGGVNGRQIVLNLHDDGYEPARAVDCFNQLLRENVFAGAFFVGSPLAARYVPMAEVTGMPLIGLLTGAQFLHEPFRPHVISVRASYNDETREQVNSLWSMGLKRIAVIYQNDAFGATVLKGVRLAMMEKGTQTVALGSFARNTLDVDDAINLVRKSHPDAVIMAGSYAPLAQIVKHSHKIGWRPIFVTVSFVGIEAFVKEAGVDAEGTVITQVLPTYGGGDLPTVVLYKKLLKKYYPGQEPDFTSFEGFVDAMVLVEGLRAAGRDLTRTKFIDALESLHDHDFGLGKFKISYGKRCHKGSDAVYSTVVRHGEPVELSDWHQLRKS